MSPDEPISVRVLRNDVSKVLKQVQAGATIDVTNHGRPVARLIPPDAAKRPGSLADLQALRARVPVDHDLLSLVRGLRSDQRDPWARVEERHRP